MSVEIKFKELYPEIWKSLSSKFYKKTKVNIELKSTKYSTTIDNKIEYQRALFEFVCNDVICGVGIQLPNYLVDDVKTSKKDFNTLVNSVLKSMLTNYKTWADTKTVTNTSDSVALLESKP
jgi:hypothetical protein